MLIDPYCHAKGTGRDGFKSELCIEAVSLPVCHETDVNLRRSVRFDVRHERCHDHLSEPMPLMFRIDRDINDVKEQGSIPDDSTHADRLALMANDDGKHGVGEPDFGGGDTPGRKAADVAQAPVILNFGSLMMRRVTSRKMHVVRLFS